MKKFFFFFFVILNLVQNTSCTQQQEQTPANANAPKVVEAKGYTVPADSISPPEVVLAGKPTVTPVGKPTIVPANTNVHEAGKPTIVLAGTPRVCTPGTDTFSLPKVVPAIDSPFVAGIPEVVEAKDAFSKAHNPGNFSSFGELQGLKSDNVTCIFQDRNGNLWFGTEGGVTKFDGKYFSHFTKKEGLNSNYVISIIQDINGNFWFGTNGGGVTRFNGKEFSNFTKKEGLISNYVTSIFQDKKGNIWFASLGRGITEYDGKTFKQFTNKVGLPSNLITSMIQDKSGNIWFGSFDGGGASKYDGKSFWNLTQKEGLNEGVFSMLEDKKGNIWFGGEELIKYDGKVFLHFNEKKGLGEGSGIIKSIIEDNLGNIWTGDIYRGVTKYNGKYFTHFTENEGLISEKTTTIHQDKNGNIWIGSQNGGVSKYNEKTFIHYFEKERFYSEKEWMNGNQITTILKDKNGILWFGLNKSGVTKYDGKSFLNYSGNDRLSRCGIHNMVEDVQGNLLFATNGGFTKFDGKNCTAYSEDEVASSEDNGILQDKKGNIWFGKQGYIVKFDGKYFTHYTKKQGLQKSAVLTIFEDNLGNIWFGSKQGASKFNGKSFTYYGKKEGLTNDKVNSICQDKNGNIWFGTADGVALYDGKFFSHYTEKEGLCNNNVMSILIDKKENIWFGTDKGLSELNLAFINGTEHPSAEKQLFKNFAYEDGFLGISCKLNAICEDNHGTIWIGVKDRLTAYNRQGDKDTIPPIIQLTSISLFNENIVWANLENKKDASFVLGNGVRVANFKFDSISKWYLLPENLKLAYNNNYVTFNFIGITQKSPKKVKYQYKLEGIDQQWSNISNNNQAPYANLPNGTFTFKVKAMNSEGYWSNEYNYTFTIRPPWWKTWWFRSLVVVCLLLVIWLFFRWRTAALRNRQKELEQTVEERTAEVVAEKKEVEEQKHLVEEKQKEILDSIEYALRIQTAILPPQRIVKQYLENSFILYKPKDIVAGDFYWMEAVQFDNVPISQLANETNQLILFAACDCTGHGVPGAMVSVVCHNALNRAVREFGLTEPAAILDKTAEIVIENFSKSEEDIKDGMDISLACIKYDEQSKKIELQWAGANNPLWIVRNDQQPTTNNQQLEEIKADKQPIGMNENQKPFTNHTFLLNEGDTIYLFTDGFADQFGGETGQKKLTRKRFKELLLSIQNKPMQEQGIALDKYITEYRKEVEQIDDILVMGVRV